MTASFKSIRLINITMSHSASETNIMWLAGLAPLASPEVDDRDNPVVVCVKCSEGHEISFAKVNGQPSLVSSSNDQEGFSQEVIDFMHRWTMTPKEDQQLVKTLEMA